MVSTLSDRAVLDREPATGARASVEADGRRWTLVAARAHHGARMRGAFRAYLERYGDRASDFDGAEAVYGELLNTSVRHAPGEVRIEFRWADSTLVVVDGRDLRAWPFSPDDTRAESTHHAYALINAFTGRIHLTRDPSGGTRASVVLPVLRAQA